MIVDLSVKVVIASTISFNMFLRNTFLSFCNFECLMLLYSITNIHEIIDKKINETIIIKLLGIVSLLQLKEIV